LNSGTSGKSRGYYRTGQQDGKRTTGRKSGFYSQTDPGNRQTIPEDTILNRAVLKLHSGLQKAESSVLVQARTGRIGLSKFLYNRKVAGVLSAQCRCRNGEEIPQHMSLFCIEEAGRRQHLRVGRRLDY
jgi:hypothetical protein